MRPDNAVEAGVGRLAKFGSSALLTHLPAALLLRVLEQLPPNELPCTARLVCKELSQLLSSPQHRTVRLSQPLPPHVGGWWRCWEGGLRRLSFHAKLGLLATAAALGCEANLEVAWRLVRPGLILPELHQRYSEYLVNTELTDPGAAAACAGHLHLLRWLVEHGCPLDPQRTLEAVAEHCDLAALRWAWKQLRRGTRAVWCAAGGAARSRTPDALDKLVWLAGGLDPMGHTAVLSAAARLGDIPLLQALRERGVGLGRAALDAALNSPAAGVEVMEWLEQQGAGGLADGMEPGMSVRTSYNKLEWVVSLDMPGVEVPPEQWDDACVEAARAGDLPAVARLHEARGAALSFELWAAAAASGCTELLSWLRARGCPLGRDAFASAAEAGDTALLSWLLREARQPLPPGVIETVVGWWPYPMTDAAAGQGAARGRGRGGAAGGEARGLMHAVQLLVGEGAVVEGPVALNAAARRGDLPLLQLLLSHGIASNGATLVCAAEGGCEEVLEWAVAQGAEAAAHAGDAYAAACASGDVATLRALLRLGVPCGEKELQLAQARFPQAAGYLAAEMRRRG